MTPPAPIPFELPIALVQETPGQAGPAETGTTVPAPGDPNAPGQPEAAPPGWTGMIPFVAMFAILWFVLIRPEKKRRRETQEMLSALKKGDRVMLTSGMYAQVVQLAEHDVTLQIADGVRVKFARAAIQSIVDQDKDKDKDKDDGGSSDG